MSSLLELQRAMREAIVRSERGAIAAMLAKDVAADRLDIYRNTFVFTATRALRLGFPAVEKLVGRAFFEAAALQFLAANPPRVAWLDHYGEGFSEHLRQFPPAAVLCYLPEVARLEWAVSRALHAPDADKLDLAGLAQLDTQQQARIRLTPEPSITLLKVAYPVDAIWRAVLAADDDALGAIDLNSGALHLLVERTGQSVEVTRIAAAEWRFLDRLCTGKPLEAAIDTADGIDAADQLAQHFARGRFCAFTLVPSEVPA